jgi:hypothetical protein
LHTAELHVDVREGRQLEDVGKLHGGALAAGEGGTAALRCRSLPIHMQKQASWGAMAAPAAPP